MKRSFIYTACLLIAGTFASKAQTPFIGQDVQHYTFNLKLNDENDTIKGDAEVTIKFTADIPEAQLNLVKKNAAGKGMLVSSVTENSKTVQFEQDDDVLHILAPQKAKAIRTFTIDYSG